MVLPEATLHERPASGGLSATGPVQPCHRGRLANACRSRPRGQLTNGLWGSAAPPWVVCDTTLADSAAGAVVTDVTMPARTLRVSYETVGGIALLTSRDCDHGATLSIDPSEAALVTKSAPTNDGKIAGATISPRRAQFTITVRHPDGTATVVKVDLARPPRT